jgi:hypothetical protein
MKRPVGVLISGVLEIAGGVLCLLVGGLQFLAYRQQEALRATMEFPAEMSLPAWTKYLPVVIFGSMGIWSLLSGVGVLWLLRWARISTLVLASLLATMGAMGIPMLFVMEAMRPAEMDEAVWQTMRATMISFYVILGAVGVWWLVYFNRPKVKAAFHAAPADASKPECPTSITLIAWFLLSAVLFFPLAIWWRPPANLFGVTFTGPAATAWNMLLMAVFAYCGWGLLKLRPVVWKHTMALAIFLLANGSIFLLVPGAYGKYQQALLASVPRLPEQPAPAISDPWAAVLFLILSLCVPMWFLWTRRERYLAACQAASSKSAV